ncbi:MAG: preprotein translocase subunit SecE [Chromatiales bacterium]|nr:preprotein translocase subunit SecE [Chromatiales bacterium]
MSTKTEHSGSPLDTVKLLLAVLMVVAGIYGFYHYEAESTLLRVLGLLVVAGLAAGIVFTTARGRGLWAFFGETRTEVRKVVWPTRQETVQTTLIVFVMVLIVAIFMWLLDLLLGWAVSSVLGGS